MAGGPSVVLDVIEDIFEKRLLAHLDRG